MGSLEALNLLVPEPVGLWISQFRRLQPVFSPIVKASSPSVIRWFTEAL